jgi:IS5 family transposase
MRKTNSGQLSLIPQAITTAHRYAEELSVINSIVEGMPEVVELVCGDLLSRGDSHVNADKGREGMTAEQVLRAALVKRLTGLSYEALAFCLADSTTYRSFIGLGFAQSPPNKSTLQRNIKRIQPATWEAMNQKVIIKAQDLGIERGRQVRSDCTVVESNIHHPTDSSLLWDCARVLARLMGEAKDLFEINSIDHTRRAKRRAMEILNAKSNGQRIKPYRDLLKVADMMVQQALQVAEQLDQIPCTSVLDPAGALASELRHYIPLAKKIVEQTRRRVLDGESVPAAEKLVSIFETHTDIIRKDNRDTLYGHKICLTTGVSGLIVDAIVNDGNPADSKLAVDTIKRQIALYGTAPRQACFDGGFASAKNLSDIKELGVKDVGFAKRCGLKIADMVKSDWVYKKLRNFRAGIEGVISFLKRSFGLSRCDWRGRVSFKAYVHSGVVAYNLLTVARRLIAAGS